MAFSFNDMGRSAAAGYHIPISAMDVSFDGVSPSPFRANQHDDDDDDEDQHQHQHQHHDVVMSSTPAVEYEEAGLGAVGYVGWPARRLILACHRIFLNGVHNEPVAVSLEHRGVIFWSLCNMDTDMEGSAVDDEGLKDEDTFHDGLTDFYHVWTLAEAFLLDSMPLPAAPLLRWLKMFLQSNEEEGSRAELEQAESAALGDSEAGVTADMTPAYWKAVRSLVVGVLPRRAAQMLRCHPHGRDNADEVGALARQLEKMPLLLAERGGQEQEDVGGGNGLAKGGLELDPELFFGTWARWQKGCKDAASSFGVVAGAVGGADRAGIRAGGGEQKRELRGLWGILCGERSCLEEGTKSWVGLLAAVLAFERPDVRKEDVAALMHECEMKYPPHDGEDFLLSVIRDASTGAVDAILRFAQEHGDTLALSACAAHLVDLLARAERPAVTNAQRSWFLRRLVSRLREFPCGGWELAAAYVSGDDADADDDDQERRCGGKGAVAVAPAGNEAARRLQVLKDIASAAEPGSERAAHELVEWCLVNNLGDAAVVDVCRARGATWLAKTGLSAAAMGIVDEAAASGGSGEGGAQDKSRRSGVGGIPGARGKAAYWLAKGGGGVQLERLCAEVSEGLMVDVSVPPVGAEDVGGTQEVAQAALDEAEGVLAAIPPEISGPELFFLARYKDIADNLMAESEARRRQRRNAPTTALERGPGARAAGFLAVKLLAPPVAADNSSGSSAVSASSQASSPPPPPRTWAHLLRLALPALKASGEAAADGQGADGEVDVVTAPQVHALLGKMQVLAASEHRVGSTGGGASGRPSTLSRAPKPYGFHGGREEVLEIRKALANCLSGAIMVQNALGGRARRVAAVSATGHSGGASRRKVPAETLIGPRVSVGS